MTPENISILGYNYFLPADNIAKFPLSGRGDSKLLVYKNEEIFTTVYNEIDRFLPEETLLVFNDTKVVEARLLFKKSTGGIIEIFCLEPSDEYADIAIAMTQKGMIRWKCLVGGAGKWKHGTRLIKIITQNNVVIELEARLAERLSNCFVIEFSWQPEYLSFAEILHASGDVPLPPYLQRRADENDKVRYQTIYAAHEGSVAAPTAGLHFTANIFDKLKKKGIDKVFVTLHVGAGTFKPVKSETLAGHDMHTEFIDIDYKTIQALAGYLNKTIVAVGTTSLRTLESLYWIGFKIYLNKNLQQKDLVVTQWEAYKSAEEISAKQSLEALCEWMREHRLQRLITKTQMLIAPGYELKIGKGIITNFHQPQSTLLLLIAAIVGDKWKEIYNYALSNDFRFLSYGDGCLLWKK